MSSILDALRKIEAAQVQTAKRAVFLPPSRRRRWPAIGVGVAFVAGVGLTLWLGRPAGPAPTTAGDEVAVATPPAPAPTTPRAKRVVDAPPAVSPPTPPTPAAAAAAPSVTPPPAPVAPPEAIAAVAPPTPDALPPAVAAPPLPQAVVDEEPPHGRVGMPAPAAPAAPVAPPAPVAVARIPPAPVSDDAAGPPADAPRVQLTMLMYSSVPARRTVALVVDGGSMVMLHEGESTHEVEVERIKPDGVQLRHRGRSFTVKPRD